MSKNKNKKRKEWEGGGPTGIVEIKVFSLLSNVTMPALTGPKKKKKKKHQFWALWTTPDQPANGMDELWKKMD